MDPGAAESIQAVILPAITTVAERALQRAIEEYRLQRPELVRTEFHSRSLEGIAGQLEQEELRQEKRDRYIDQICLVAHKLLHQNRGLLKVQWKV